MSILYAVFGNIEFVWAPIALALTVGGFSVLEFPPLRVFSWAMRVVGSWGLRWASCRCKPRGSTPHCYGGILLGVFIVDATCTLVVRLVKGDKVHEAHRSHAYHASRQFGGHLPITLSVTGINLIWLLPIVTLVALGSLDGFVGLLIAYVPLILLALRFMAGQREG